MATSINDHFQNTANASDSFQEAFQLPPPNGATASMTDAFGVNQHNILMPMTANISSTWVADSGDLANGRYRY